MKSFLARLRGRVRTRDHGNEGHGSKAGGPPDARPGSPLGTAAGEEIAILLRIEGHLAELVARARHLERLDRRLRDIETALRQL